MAEKPRAGESAPAKEFTIEGWLRDGLDGIRSKVENRTGRFDTSSFRTHMRNARREQLLAVRSLIDSAIERLETGEEKAKS